MSSKRLAAAFVLALLAFAGWTAVAAADCSVRPGDKVALIGNADDPDVFVWDSRFRLATYQAGSWDVSKALLPHAIVAQPGTRAQVIACHSNAIHPKYRMAYDDAVGIIIMTGQYRGKAGWVMGEDLRRMYRPKRRH